MATKSFFRTKWFVLGAIALALLIAMTWQNIMLGIGFALADKRPALLGDARWDTPVLAFQQRFDEGTPEADLLRWLDDNKFEDVHRGGASRTIHGLPCQERVEVRWSAIDGVIIESSAVVSEEGCL
ncbi:hypothetical protein [Croceicoccus gelatinilyticus]|uniref:hypothetical protein n=1 Tax=Croceicoccus gelatinilyticus TaxID=2835536 RepID=UPI001BCD6DFC|nr:hypothetical protein [Croceicoccus gelatinilyticus]MBS7671440.1 hypothetical protein [Croceicoccus gelatinilyticus]